MGENRPRVNAFRWTGNQTLAGTKTRHWHYPAKISLI
jgi:hypothetical protein